MKSAGVTGLALGALALFIFSRNSAGQSRGIEEGEPAFEVGSFDPAVLGEEVAMGIANISQQGLEALKTREGGFQQFKYVDAGGYSIGYGHFILPNEDYDAGITQEYAEYLLQNDVQKAVFAINSFVSVPLTQNQFDALVSFVYNVGVTAFKKSTLLKKLNAGDTTAVNEFSRWNLSGGVVNSGLVSRRESEAAQFMA